MTPKERFEALDDDLKRISHELCTDSCDAISRRLYLIQKDREHRIKIAGIERESAGWHKGLNLGMALGLAFGFAFGLFVSLLVRLGS